MKDLQVVAALTKCRDQYMRDIKEIDSAYQKQKKALEAQLASIESRDFTEEFLPTYEKVYGVFTRLYRNIEEEQKRTHGLRSHIGDFLKKASPRTTLNDKLNTDGWVEQVKGECSDAVRRINTSSSVEGFDAPIKQFCQAMVDMQYICQNATKLLKASGLYQGAERQATAQTKDRIKFNKEQYEEAKKFENLPCYKNLMELKAKLEQALRGADDDLLQNGSVEFGNGYEDRVLMGFSPIKEMTDDLVSFAREVLGVDVTPLHQSPVFFPIDSDHSSIIFEMSPQQMASKKTTAYMEKLLFSFLSSVPCKKLTVSAIECKRTDGEMSIGSVLAPVVKRLEDKLGKSPFLFAPTAKTSEEAADVIGSLFRICETRAEDYEAFGHSSIFDYNRATPDNQHEFHLLLVNNYPFGFESAATVNKLKALMRDCSAGVLVVVFQSNDSEDYLPRQNEDGKKIQYHRLDADACGSDLVTDFNDAKFSFVYNGKLAYHNIAKAGFDAAEYWKDLSSSHEKANVLYLDKMLEQIVAKGVPYTTTKSKFRIPIGQKDGKYYDFITDIKSAPSAIILGASGSGKSSFLHTLILSAAYLYTPDELEFYLTDFKSADSSADFINYCEGQSLYVPHVRYLSMKSTAENAFDILDMIENLHNGRQKILAEHGVADVANFNSLPEVQEGKTKPMSRILFFIDEYLTFLGGGAGTVGNLTTSDVITSRLAKQLTRVRSSGICIILCGQFFGGIDKNALSQFGTRIGLNGYSQEIMQFTIDDLDRKTEINKKLTQPGMVLMSANSGIDKDLIRFAFTGDTGKKRQVSLAEKIRQRHSAYKMPPQVIAGSTASVPITQDESLSARIKEDGRIDPNSYVLYMGHASSSAAPIGIRLSTDNNAMGYHASMVGSDRLWQIERAVLLAFLETTATRGISYKGPRATYCWMRSGSGDELGNCLKDEMVLYPELNRHIAFSDEAYECGKAIMTLYHLYKERKKGAKNIDRTPRLLLLHNPEWLSTTGWGKDMAASTAPAEESDTKKIQQDINSTITASLGSDKATEFGDLASMMASFMSTAAANPEPEEVLPDEVLYFSEAQVKNAVKDLYNNGHRENIFVFITTEMISHMREYFQANGRQEDAMHYTVTDSFGENQKKYPRSCTHIKSFKKIIELDEKGNEEYTLVPVNSKTRMYVYDVETEFAWWNHLMDILRRS